MTARTPCPDPARLRDLLADGLPDTEQAELTGHLDICACCQEALERLATGESAVAACVRHIDRDEPAPNSAYWQALRRVEGEVTRADTSTGTAVTEEVSLDFLTPS